MYVRLFRFNNFCIQRGAKSSNDSSCIYLEVNSRWIREVPSSNLVGTRAGEYSRVTAIPSSFYSLENWFPQRVVIYTRSCISHFFGRCSLSELLVLSPVTRLAMSPYARILIRHTPPRVCGIRTYVVKGFSHVNNEARVPPLPPLSLM